MINAKLVHPICWLGRLVVPSGGPVEHKVNVPGQCASARQGYEPSQRIPEALVSVPKMQGSFIGHTLRRRNGRLTIVLLQYGRPDNIDPQPRVGNYLKYVLLHHTGTVLAWASRWRQNENESDTSCVMVECVFQLLFVFRQRNQPVSAAVGSNFGEHLV